MKKLSILLIPVLVLSMLFSSCDRSYDEAVVKAAARELLEKSNLVNEIFYGVGLPYDSSNSAVASGNYKPASEEYLSSIGVSNIQGLKSLAKEVYTDELCEIIFKTTFESVKDSSGDIVIFSRYAERITETRSYILVYSELAPVYENEVEYLYDTLSVIGAEGDYIHIKIDVRLTSYDGLLSRVERGAEFILLEEEDGFRLDSPSFVKY